MVLTPPVVRLPAALIPAALLLVVLTLAALLPAELLPAELPPAALLPEDPTPEDPTQEERRSPSGATSDREEGRGAPQHPAMPGVRTRCTRRRGSPPCPWARATRAR